MYYSNPETKTQSQKITTLYDLGLQVVPGGAHKHPEYTWKKWQTERVDPDLFQSWVKSNPENWCIITGKISGIVAVDADDEAAREYLQRTCPATPITQKTSRGEHWLYRYPGFSVGNRAKINGLNLDVRGDGGLIVWKGSTWTAEQFKAMPVFDPDWFPTTRRDEVDADDVEHDEAIRAAWLPPMAERYKQAQEYIYRTPGAVEFEGGDKHTYHVACTLVKGFALSIEVAQELLDDWNETCTPPWNDRVLVRNITNAAKEPGKVGYRLKSEWVHEAGEKVHDKFYTEKQHEPTNKSRILTMDELISLPKPDWLIDQHILQNTITTIFGKSGSFKSFYALLMALSLAYGIPFLGKFPVKRKMRVLYLASEGMPGFSKRLAAWRTAHKDAPRTNNIFFWGESFNLHQERERNKVINMSAERMGAAPEVVVIDTLSRNFGGKDTSSNTDMQCFMDSLAMLKNTTVIIVHHAGWSDLHERGASAVRDCSDTVFKITRDDKASYCKASCVKQKDGEEVEDYFANANVYDTGFSAPDDTCLVLSYGNVATDTAQYENLVRFAKMFQNGKTTKEVFDANKVVLEAMGWNTLGTLKNKVAEAIKLAYLTIHADSAKKHSRSGMMYCCNSGAFSDSAK